MLKRAFDSMGDDPARDVFSLPVDDPLMNGLLDEWIQVVHSCVAEVKTEGSSGLAIATPAPAFGTVPEPDVLQDDRRREILQRAYRLIHDAASTKEIARERAREVVSRYIDPETEDEAWVELVIRAASLLALRLEGGMPDFALEDESPRLRIEWTDGVESFGWLRDGVPDRTFPLRDLVRRGIRETGATLETELAGRLLDALVAALRDGVLRLRSFNVDEAESDETSTTLVWRPRGVPGGEDVPLEDLQAEIESWRRNAPAHEIAEDLLAPMNLGRKSGAAAGLRGILRNHATNRGISPDVLEMKFVAKWLDRCEGARAERLERLEQELENS